MFFDNFEQRLFDNSTISQIWDSKIIYILRYVDVIMRFYALTIYIGYFCIIFKRKEFRLLSFAFVNNVNLTGFLFIFHYVCYSFHSRPNTQNAILNEVLCRISEIIWASFKYLNTYSILLLAYYRYIAVCKFDFYNRITKTKSYIISPILILWCLSILFAITSKYLFNTSAGLVLCYDGYSIDVFKSIYYYIFTASFAIIIPSVLILYLYANLLKKLRLVTSKVSNKQYTKKCFDKWNNVIKISSLPQYGSDNDASLPSMLENNKQNHQVRRLSKLTHFIFSTFS